MPVAAQLFSTKNQGFPLRRRILRPNSAGNIEVDKFCQLCIVLPVSEIGKRLKNARVDKGLTARQAAKRLGLCFTVLSRIESGKRFPPKKTHEKIAEFLSLEMTKLQSLIAVERRGLDPFAMLPEIVPAPIPTESIEIEAEKVLARYSQESSRDLSQGPVPVEDVIKVACGLSTEHLDFAKSRIRGQQGGNLYGCLYPDGYRRRDRVVLVNSGYIRGRQLSSEERQITVAHEAGHYVLHYGNKESKQLFFRFSKEPTYCREEEIKPGPFNLKEDQATLFAACLLMPRKRFKEEWKRVFGDRSRLARHFRTTTAFVQFRSAMLGS
jgi:transcriptional regulator with XRE-family HTH domain